MLDHGGLNGVQPAIRAPQMLDRDDVATVARGEEADAGIDRFVMQMPVMQPADQNGAGTAIPLGTAFLGAGQATVQPQEIQ